MGCHALSCSVRPHVALKLIRHIIELVDLLGVVQVVLPEVLDESVRGVGRENEDQVPARDDTGLRPSRLVVQPLVRPFALIDDLISRAPSALQRYTQTHPASTLNSRVKNSAIRVYVAGNSDTLETLIP